jgi:hypothetical protein
MLGKRINQIARQQAKESANWRCQNPACQRDCLRPGQTLDDLIARTAGDHGQESELSPNSIQPFIMKAVSDGQGGYLALCGSCALKFVHPSPHRSFVQTKLELLGQLRLL